MTNIGSNHTTPAQWYKGVAGELWLGFKLVGKVDLKAWWQEHEDTSLAQRLRQFISNLLLVQFPNERLLIFIDEIDSILSLNFSVDDFFALICFCYNQRATNPEFCRITFAIFGVATPSDLITDCKRTPFNIGKGIDLQDFTFEEAKPLTQGLAVGQADSQVILKEILRWSRGQPFLTQKLCHLVANTSQDAANIVPKIPVGTEALLVERIVKTHLIDWWEFQDEPEHFRTIHDRLLHSEQHISRMLGIYQQLLEGVKVQSNDS